MLAIGYLRVYFWTLTFMPSSDLVFNHRAGLAYGQACRLIHLWIGDVLSDASQVAQDDGAYTLMAHISTNRLLAIWRACDLPSFFSGDLAISRHLGMVLLGGLTLTLTFCQYRRVALSRRPQIRYREPSQKSAAMSQSSPMSTRTVAVPGLRATSTSTTRRFKDPCVCIVDDLDSSTGKGQHWGGCGDKRRDGAHRPFGWCQVRCEERSFRACGLP